MGDFTKLAKKVVSVARGEDKKKPSPYDTKATVNRVDYENRKAYVRFYGGVDETPVDLTVNCERGDTVQVRVGGGRAWIVGNQTAPPTDDKAVNILNHTVNNLRNQLDKTKEELEEEIEEIEPGEGKLIKRIATEYILSELNYLVDDKVVPYEPTPGEPMEWSEELPEWVSNPRTYYWTRTVIYYTDGTVDEQDPILDQNAQISAEADFAISSENNHFWHDTTGAYVTEQDKNAALGYASRVTNAGILQTYNNNLLTSWTGSGIAFYDGTSSTASESTKLATFGTGGVTFNASKTFTVGNNSSYIRWINTGTDLSPVWKLQINADTIQFGSDSTDISDVVNPYEIETSVESIIANTNSGTTTPTSVTVYFKKAGSSTSGYLYVEKTTNGTSWSQHYGPSQSASFTIPLSSDSSIKFYRFSWYEESAMTNLKNSKTIPVIATGEEGAGIDDTTITYATSSSYYTPPSSGWQSTPPYVSQGYYLWTKTIFSYSDGTSSDPVYSVARQGVNGQNGTDVTSQYVTYITDANGVVVRHAGNNDSYPYLMCNATGVYNYYSDKYFSKVDSTGLKVYAGSSSYPKSVFNSSGATIYSGTDYTYPVATFGATTTIGKTNGSHVVFGSDEITFYQSGAPNKAAGTIYLPSSEEFIEINAAYSSNKTAYIEIEGANSNQEIRLRAQSASKTYYELSVEPAQIGILRNGKTVMTITSTGNIESDYLISERYAAKPNCYITSTGSIGKTSHTNSTRRHKEDISPLIDDSINPAKLYSLPVMQYKYKPGHLFEGHPLNGKLLPGFIAEDVNELYPIATIYDVDDPSLIDDWDERFIIPPMLALIQDQKKMIDSLEERVSALEGGLQ